MHQTLFTLRAHDDINKFEREDGVIRGVVAALLAEESSIVEIRADIPRDLSADLELHVPCPTDNISIQIVAEEEADANPDLSTLASEFATLHGTGAVTRLDVSQIRREWVGTAVPGVALRITANRAPGIDLRSFTQWVSDSLERCSRHFSDIGTYATVAHDTSVSVPAVTAYLQFPDEKAVAMAINEGKIAPMLDGELLDRNTVTADLVTVHRVLPNPNIWT